MDLKIYISEHCWGCKEAREVAAQMQRLYPKLAIKLVDLDAEEEEKPEEVFATPTYVLNGRVVSLGNPRLEALCELIDAELQPNF
jgi:alkyl hydroperoxide reductase subunit AhpF